MGRKSGTVVAQMRLSYRLQYHLSDALTVLLGSNGARAVLNSVPAFDLWWIVYRNCRGYLPFKLLSAYGRRKVVGGWFGLQAQNGRMSSGSCSM